MTQSSSKPVDRRTVMMGAGVLGAIGASAVAKAQVPANPPGAGPITAGRDTKLSGKVAFVTGAARGIGRAIAVELAANGADVAIFDIAGYVSPASNAKPATRADLAETKRQIEGFGRRCIAIKGDIRKIVQLRAAHDRVVTELDRVDIVVADAAIQRWKDRLEMEDSDWYDVIDNDVNGTANTVRAFAPTLCAQKSGRIIPISPMQGKHGTAGASSYSASKHAIIGLMKSAEAETWSHRAPRVPLRVAWLKPEDVSPMAVSLASDASAMCSGANFEVTGGDSAQDV